MERWHGKTAVVTGAGGGMGAAIASALAKAGLRVVGLEKNEQLFNGMLKTGIEDVGVIIPRQCDISRPEEIAAQFIWIEEQLGGVHVLVNNAGVLYQGQITEAGTDTLTDEQILSSIDTNIKGTIFCARHAVASMKKNHLDGHIININSLAGHYIPFSSSMNVYASTKHAITAFTETLRYELADFGSKIRTTSISPGLTNSNMASHMEGLDQLPTLQPKDIADAVLYALSTPSHVNISELTIQPVMEKRL